MSKFLFRRYLLFCVALFVNALGIAFITRAALGTSPITSVTYVLSMFTPFTIGQWTIMLNILFVVLEPFMMTRQDLKDDLDTDFFLFRHVHRPVYALHIVLAQSSHIS